MYETPLHKKYGTFSFLPISLAQLIISETSGSHIIVNCVSILELLPVQTSNTQRASHVASDLGEAVQWGRWTKEIHEASRADFLRLQGQPGFNKLSAGLQAWNFTRPLHSPFGEGKSSPVVAGERGEDAGTAAGPPCHSRGDLPGGLSCATNSPLRLAGGRNGNWLTTRSLCTPIWPAITPVKAGQFATERTFYDYIKLPEP